MRHLISVAVAITLALPLSSCRTMAPQETGFLDRSVHLGSSDYPYSVYVPRHFTRSRSWPVILFLHGSGERGTDGLAPSQVGLGTAIRFDPSRVPAIVVFPQAPPETRWAGEPAVAAMAALETSAREFNGDPGRTYLTGLSMGGYGAIHLALAHPGRFAALVVVCGGVLPQPSTTAVMRSPLIPANADPYAFVAQSLKSTPIWLFHGADDPVIPADESRHIFEELKKAGAADAQLTIYEKTSHNAWDKAYAEAQLWKWLFAKSERTNRTERTDGTDRTDRQRGAVLKPSDASRVHLWASRGRPAYPSYPSYPSYWSCGPALRPTQPNSSTRAALRAASRSPAAPCALPRRP